MLNTMLRTASVTALILIAACEFSSAPSIGQSSGNKKKGDAGSEDAQAQRRVRVAKPLPESDAAVDAETRSIGDASDQAAQGGKAGAGGKAGSKSTAGKGGSVAKDDGDKADDKDQNKPPQEDPKPDQGTPANKGDGGPVDAGAQPSTPDAAMGDAGARPMVDDPNGVLEGLASRSPGGRTAETINRFLETIATGDAPAGSIKEFLDTIDSEMDCKMNPFATECLAACQAVSVTCWVCVLDEPCRTSLLEICGYSALAGCARRG